MAFVVPPLPIPAAPAAPAPANNTNNTGNTNNAAHTNNANHPHPPQPQLSSFHAGHGHAPGISEGQAIASDAIKVGAEVIGTLSKTGVHVPKPVSQAKDAAKAVKEVIEHPQTPFIQTLICNHGVNVAQAALSGGVAGKIAKGVVSAVTKGAATVGAYKAVDQVTSPVANAVKTKCNAAGDALRHHVEQGINTITAITSLPTPARSAEQRERVMDQTVQALVKDRMVVIRRNPYFNATQRPFLSIGLPSWQDRLNSFPRSTPTPGCFEIRSAIRNAMGFSYSGPQSISSICSKVSHSLGGSVSDLAIRSALGSCYDIVSSGGYAMNRCALEDLKTRAFAGLLGSTGLSSTYNSYHPDALMNAWLCSWGMIGGVAQKVAVLEGSDIGDFKEHMIALKMAQMPFTSAELQQISKELYDGIFIHNNYPFFSLDFNTDCSLFPLIPPCYERTLVGKIIGFLDAHLKGFLNGALYPDDLLQNWHLTANHTQHAQQLKLHLRDLKKLLPEYYSPREMLCLMEVAMQSQGIPHVFDLVKLCTRTTFRIIANQNKVQRHENVFLIDPDFTVEYTIDLPPEVEEYVKSYRNKHGEDPHEYTQLHAAHKLFAENIKKQMPTLPGLDRYFHMLGVINFLCYYYHTLKLTHQAPLLPPTTYPFPAFPKCLPSLPVRYYQQHKIHFTLGMLLNKLAPIKKELNTFLYQQFWFEGEKEIPGQIEQAVYNAMEQLLKQQIGQGRDQGDLEPKSVRSLADKCLAILMNVAMGIGEKIFENSLTASNQTLLSAIRKEGAPVPELYERIKLKEEELKRQGSSAAKWTYIQQGIARAVQLIQDDLQAREEAAYQKLLTELPSRIKNDIESTIELAEKALQQINAQCANLHQQLNANASNAQANIQRQIQDAITEQTRKVRLFQVGAVTQAIQNEGNKLLAQHQQTVTQGRAAIDQAFAADRAPLYDILSKTRQKRDQQQAEVAKEKAEITKLHQEILEKNEESLKELKKTLDDQALEIAQKIYTISDELLKVPKIAEQPVIKQNYLHSVLEIPTTTRDDMRIVGGCSMDLGRLKPTSLGFGSHFVQASQGLSHNVFHQFKVGEENYVAFKMATKPFVQEESDGKIGQAENELMQSQGYTALMIAALGGDEESARAALSRGESPDIRLPSGMDALMLAIQNGEEQLALSLLKSNKIANISRPLENGMTPLHLAVQLKLPLVAKELIQRNANPTARRKLDDYTPLHLAAHFGNHPPVAELIPLMKAKGVNINLALPSSGKTPLHIAVERGIDPTFLIQAGANPDIQDKEGRTPLHCAILAGESAIAEVLAEKATIGLENARGETASLLAMRYDTMFYTAHKMLCRGEMPLLGSWKQDQRKRDVPYYAARHGSVRFLESFGYKLYGLEETLLKTAAQHGHGLFVCAMLEKKRMTPDQTLFGDIAALDATGLLGKYVQENLQRYKLPLTFFLGAIERGNRLLLPHFPFSSFNPGTSKQALMSAMKGGSAPYFALVWQEIEKRGLNPKQLSIELQLTHEAVKYGRMDILKQLYRFGMPMHLVNHDGKTPRELALHYEDDDLVELFNEYGVPRSHSLETKEGKESKETKEPYPPQAVQSKKAPEALVKKMQQLLRVPRLKQWNDWVRTLDHTMLFNGLPLLHHLLALDPDSHENFAQSAMQHLASIKVNPLLKGEASIPLSFVLLKCQTEKELKSKLGWIQEAFPQHFAQILVQTDKEGLNLCDQMILNGSSKLLKALDRKVPSEKAFHYAAMRGDLEAVRHLIDSEVPCECFDEKLSQPLHYAAQYGHNEIVEELLSHRVNPFLGNRNQNLPLHMAIINKHVEAAQRLIDYMPNPDRPNRDGQTPLMLAAKNGCVPLIVRLIPCSNLYAVDAQGRNALHLAALHGSQEGVETLLKAGMKIDVGTTQMQKGQEGGFTALYFAAIKGHLELFRFLISKRAEIYRVGTSGTTILDGMVASNNVLMHTELLRLPEFSHENYQKSLPKTAAQHGNLAVLRELYLMGVPLDRFDEHGMAPLHYAVIQQHHEIVHFLLEHGVFAELPTANNLNKTPLDLANSESMRRIITPFLNASVLPAMPPPMPTPWGYISPFKQSDPVPYDFQEGLTAQERALIFHTDSEPCCALASRVKKELGVYVLYMILSKKHKVYTWSNAMLIQIMTLALELGDYTKLTEPLKGANLEEVHDLLLGVYQKTMLEKQPARSPAQLAARFSQKSDFVDEPLSTQAANEHAKEYQRLCDFAPSCRQKSQQDLAKLARTTQEPLEALAAIVESIRRTFKITPYDTQLFALLALIHNPFKGTKGAMGQIRTGEGKSTIIAMLAAYYAVRGRTVYIITTTPSLGKRDQAKYQAFYTAMGVTSSHICTRQPEKREFNGEVLYGTNSDFEFALLRQELYNDQARYALGSCRPQDVAIIDEVDSLFLDLALSEAHLAEPVSQDDSWLYKPYLEWIRTHERYDFEAVKQHLEGARAHAKDPIKGNAKGDSQPELSDKELRLLFDKGKQALKQTEDIDYVVQKDSIVIVDYNNTGSTHEGCRWEKGLHEFLEAKHNVPVKTRSMRLASVSHVAFFRQYKTLIGLSGTIGEIQERAEIRHLYNVDLFDVPPHFPNQLVNMPSRLLPTQTDYYNTLLQSLQVRLQEGRPVLILLHTIQDTLKMSEKLKEAHVEHQLLNAVQQEEEAYLLTRAGQAKAVTIATNAAGRGTDIILSESSKRARGLHVIFGFCPINLRVQRQGEGRAGRQGQPGTSEIITYVGSPSVQSILAPAGSAGSGGSGGSGGSAGSGGEAADRTSCEKWDTLMHLRTNQVQALSLYRMIRAERSIVLFEMLSDFLKIRKIIEKSFESDPVKQSLYRKNLSASWSQFYEEMEQSRLGRDALLAAYAQFKKEITPSHLNFSCRFIVKEDRAIEQEES